jgi:uncharacterized membrane-anchored protein YhcB (DUF1043 family)
MIALEGTSSMWIVGLLGFLLGTTLGCIAAYLVFSRNGKTHELQAELNELKENFTNYRDQVTQHFMQTSSLVLAMTENYRAVYEHLASGAQHLCNVDKGANRLQQKKNEEIDSTHASGVISAATGFDNNDLEELSKIRSDIDQLMGESPHIPDIDSTPETENKSPLQH